MADLSDLMREYRPEEVTFVRNEKLGVTAILVIHSTKKGPALGGTRLLRYPSELDALMDALRVAEAMTYKAAIAGLPCGGGKLIVLEPQEYDRTALFRWLGEKVESLGGRFFTGRDAGVTHEDIQVMREVTKHAVDERPDKVGNLDWYTALGIVEAMKACRHFLEGTQSLKGAMVAVQGVGNVGRELCGALRGEGANLIVADTNPQRAAEAASLWNAKVVSPDEIMEVEADILAPCAVSRTVNAETAPRIRAGIICGSANDMLDSLETGDLLFQRGTVYAPDFIVNAGALIQAGSYYLLGRKENSDRVRAIYYTVEEVLQESQAKRKGSHRVALEIARSHLH
ncbi:MAG: Glu/Leu/Phe/Val dehydrogenase dimerization domain-containing protein [bacterium JZ-2024 1]